MSIQVLHNADDTMATLYQSSTDWAFGPVIYTHGTNVSARMLAEKFIAWAGLRNRGPFDDWSDAWIERKWSEFSPAHWRNCPECYGEALIQSHEAACTKCEHTCAECGDEDVETTPKSRPGKKAVRMCADCTEGVTA